MACGRARENRGAAPQPKDKGELDDKDERDHGPPATPSRGLEFHRRGGHGEVGGMGPGSVAGKASAIPASRASSVRRITRSWATRLSACTTSVGLRPWNRHP